MRWRQCRAGAQEAAADGELERARAAGAELAAARASVEQLTAQLDALRAQAAATQVRGTYAAWEDPLPGSCLGCSTATHARLQLLSISYIREKISRELFVSAIVSALPL
jgi:hypothetical protein